MRLALASLIAIAGLAPTAFAQTPPVAPPSGARAAPTPPAPTPPAATPPATAPGAPAVPPTPGASTPGAPTPPAATPAAPTPPPPPAPPTDPAAIGVLNALDAVCVPLVSGGDLAKLAKAAGFRKSGDNYVYKQKTYQLTVLAPGSNPNQCHVDIVHPIDPEAPAKPIVIALHDWAAVTRGWSLYRNDKNVLGSQEFTTRSWEGDENGKHLALVLTTKRKADGSPSQRNADTSEMIYGIGTGSAAPS